MAFPITIAYADNLETKVIFSPEDLPFKKAFTIIDIFNPEEEKIIVITRDNLNELPKVLPEGTLMYIPSFNKWSTRRLFSDRKLSGMEIQNEQMGMWIGAILRIPK